MLNQRRCCHCGGAGPFACVATCQDVYGDVSGYLCLCVACDDTLSEAEFRRRVSEQAQFRAATPLMSAPQPDMSALPGAQ